MRYNSISLPIIVACLITVPVHADTSAVPAHAEAPSATSTPSKATPNSSSEERLTYLDVSDFNLTTPTKAVISFVQQFNGIHPAYPLTDLQEICHRSVSSSYTNSCMTMLEDRLKYLKTIARNLKGANFKYQPPAQLNVVPMKFKASWRETLSFFDGATKFNDKSMNISLGQEGSEWKITLIEQ